MTQNCFVKDGIYVFGLARVERVRFPERLNGFPGSGPGVRPITNDTDIPSSNAGLRATNDLGICARMTEGIATRVSYRTEFNDSPDPGAKNMENTR
jgi:hypothetical protein